MTSLLTLLLPLFLLTALGCALARTRLLAPSWQADLTELTAKVFIPALLFSGASKNGIPASMSWQTLAAFFIPLLLLFLAAAFGLRRQRAGAARALAATYSNTVFVGIPVLARSFGPDSLQYAFPVIAFHSLVAFTLYYLAASHASGAAKLSASLWNVVSNPIVVSLMLGLACNGAGLAPAAPLAAVLALLAGAALPCALLALGASLATFRVDHWLETGATVAAKLLLLPACVLGMALLAFGLPPAATSVLVVIAACPVGVNAAALVQADGEDAGVVSSAILLSSVLCMATLPFWIWIVSAL
ncbi:AEC family transporter [Massilia sp. TSP1-1-2]|uniref:AEC family transporter n=1 Tax=unclassified Massilia TaxID=2609279 RepID=UPI003CF55EFE